MFAEILQLDTRTPARQAVLADLARTTTFGLEVTDAEYALACAAGNVDPQHLGARADLSAIEVMAALLKGEVRAATVQPDLDSLGSMAVLEIAMELVAQVRALEGEVMRRIEMIGVADRFERGGWPGVRPFPTREVPWFESAGASESYPLAAMAAVVRDNRLSLAGRVALLKRWLATGEEPAQYRNRVETERLEMIAALEGGSIRIVEVGNGRIAAVVSTHQAGIGLGYHRAPVVIALNPSFQFRGGAPYKKFTIAQFTGDYLNLRAALESLNRLEAAYRGVEVDKLENRWGGSPTIGGSPQGESSEVTLKQVQEIVEQHLL